MLEERRSRRHGQCFPGSNGRLAKLGGKFPQETLHCVRNKGLGQEPHAFANESLLIRDIVFIAKYPTGNKQIQLQRTEKSL